MARSQRIKKPLAQRLSEKLRFVPETGCLIYTGHCDRYGYIITGSRTDGTRKLRKTHRVAWELAYGPIPSGMAVLHRCDNPPCCNAEHLFLGTQGDNVRDMVAKNRHYVMPLSTRWPGRGW